jgi:outer membrane cobalamin receptor
VEYQIDKKVINVAEQLTSISGTAVDVLEKVPSVTVDVEGKVSLRGSSNYTVLIDGRPSVLDPDDALQQIPASTIETIEIITNPSAKYDPDGTAGIINILLKKGQSQHLGGVVNASGGFDDKYGGDFLITRRTGSVDATFSADYNQRTHPGSSQSESWTIREGVTSFLSSQGSSDSDRERYGFRASSDWHMTDRDLLGLSSRFGYLSGDRTSLPDS